MTPPNAEIADLFTMLVSGTQRFAGLVQLGAAITLALATAGVARRVGLGPAPAAFGGLVLLTLPVVTTQEWTALNDLVVASFLVTAVYFLLGSGRIEPALGGLATALAVGTKFTALLALPVLAGAVLAVRGTKGAARLAWPLVAGVAAGSVWYVLNLAETGKVDGGLASSAGQTPDTVGSILGTLHRFLFDVLDLSGSPSADWRLDHLHGAGGSLYRAAGLALLAVAAALALRRPAAVRSRSRAPGCSWPRRRLSSRSRTASSRAPAGRAAPRSSTRRTCSRTPPRRGTARSARSGSWPGSPSPRARCGGGRRRARRSRSRPRRSRSRSCSR